MKSGTSNNDNHSRRNSDADSFEHMTESTSTIDEELSFPFRHGRVPVTHGVAISREHAIQAIRSEPFVTWYRRCEQRRQEGGTKGMEIHSVEIQSVDMFGARGVGFIKMVSHCTLVDGQTHHHEHRLPGICFLRGSGVSILVALFCQEEENQQGDDDDDNDDTAPEQKDPSSPAVVNSNIESSSCSTYTSVYSLLVEQPRVPIGQVSCLELPAGMMDDSNESVAGIAVQEMQEECGIMVRPNELIDLTELACREAVRRGHLPLPAIPSSPGGCDEMIRYLYLEKSVTPQELSAMKGRLQGQRQHGEFITLHVVPMDDVWRISGDAKAMISLFLLDQLRRDGILPSPGTLATPLKSAEPMITLADRNKTLVPQMAFGLYQVPDNVEGEQIVLNAVHAGYRHFDGASFYDNEVSVGRALQRSGVARQDFFLVGKVWNDAVKAGRAQVRASVENSLAKLDFGNYFDLFMIHWPVPGCFVEAYKEMELLHKEGKIRALGISNFTPHEYEELIAGGISILPVVNQLEVSPAMYRKDLIEYFQERKIVVSAYKALNRASCLDRAPLVHLADKYAVTAPQVMLRWGLQKGLIVVSKTSNPDRMKENRALSHFVLSVEDMTLLDSMTSEQDRMERDQTEIKRKTAL